MNKLIMAFLLFLCNPLYAVDEGAEYYFGFYYSPVSVVNFTGNAGIINDSYDFNSQLKEIPIKNAGFEFLKRNDFSRRSDNTASSKFLNLISSDFGIIGASANFSHNRLNSKKIFKDDSDEKKERYSINFFSIALTSMSPVSFVSKKLLQKTSLGFALVEIWEDNLIQRDKNIGIFLSYGMRYYFSELTPDKSSVNMGFDLQYAGSYLQATDKKYYDISMIGIYPYIGYSW